ncbi:MAG: flagellar hook-associated protein FlgL [Glaciecola sp.]|jgi:flagellar hook-associated protein 3 FlgL
MRISTNQIYTQNLRSISANQSALSETQDQLSTGKKLTKPSDDPVGAAKLIRITEELDKITQYNRNTNLLKSSLEQQETVLSSIKDSANRARVLSVQAGNGIMTQDDKNAIASEMKQIRNEIFDLMNSQNSGGEYIFAGYQSQTQAFSYNYANPGNKFSFNGDTGTNIIRVSDSVTLKTSSSGQDIFQNVYARKNFSIDSTSMNNVAQLEVKDHTAFERFHQSMYDPGNIANNQLQFTMINASELQVTQLGTGDILDVVSFASGDKFQYQGMEIEMDASVGQSTIIALDPPQKKNIAETLNDFIEALENDTISAGEFSKRLSDTIVGIDNAMDKISIESSSIGGRLNIADSIYASNLDMELANKKAQATIEDLDYAEATTRFAKQETALEAALATFPKVSSLSLFQYI